MSPTEDRSFKTLRSDAEISLRINEALLSPKYQDLYGDVSSDVYEGVVLITGTLKYSANKKRVTKLMRTIKGVKKHLLSDDSKLDETINTSMNTKNILKSKLSKISKIVKELKK